MRETIEVEISERLDELNRVIVTVYEFEIDGKPHSGSRKKENVGDYQIASFLQNTGGRRYRSSKVSMTRIEIKREFGV